MKILLVNPPDDLSSVLGAGKIFIQKYEPLGLLYIAAVLEREGVDVEIVPAEVLEDSWKDVERVIEDRKPDIVGVTSTTENRFQSFELLKRSKRVRPQALSLIHI